MADTDTDLEHATADAHHQRMALAGHLPAAAVEAIAVAAWDAARAEEPNDPTLAAVSAARRLSNIRAQFK